ncbi:translation initiation factor IF-2 [Patescibacteria group bacterium]|nr:translation initiation factor IF-2 [Patescibacteria group bacterium]
MTPKANQEKNKNLVTRPPIVVVMGHIDHGKTTLLDSIRKTNVVEKESGGITQHIGAYEVTTSTKEEETRKITFLDTPGHAAFSKMRSRGARVADVAILVVAADDGVKPQTKEALDAIKEADIPFVVALNKIDKPEADPEKIKKELSEADILIEEWGGKIPFVPLSAKTGQGVDELLEMILLISELEDLKADPRARASGVIIEAHRDPKRGNTATLIIQNGTLRQGEFIVSKNTYAPVRIFEDFLGDKIGEATFSQPVRVVGFLQVPEIGSMFITVDSKKAAETEIKGASVPAEIPPKTKTISEDSKEKQKSFEIPIVLKADVAGSLEALEDEIKRLGDGRFMLTILQSEVGAVSENDMKMASGSPNVLVVAFRVKIEKSAQDMAKRFGITLKTFDVIYEATDWLKEEIEKRLPKETIEKIFGRAKLLRIFKKEGERQVVGGKVKEGAILLGKKFRVVRRGNMLGEGRIIELQHQKAKTSSVEEGKEFGILTTSKITLAPGDEIEIFEEEEVKPKL